MPTFILKGKDKPPQEMIDFLQENREDYLRIDIEVETSHERLRRSFHALINAWFDSGEWSANGTAEIYCYDRLRDYYKYQGCQKFIGYRYKKNNFKTLEELFDKYPTAEKEHIDPIVKSWTDMTKKEKRTALDCVLTEIRYSKTSNRKVLEWVAKITGDIDMIKEIGL